MNTFQSLEAHNSLRKVEFRLRPILNYQSNKFPLLVRRWQEFVRRLGK